MNFDSALAYLLSLGHETLALKLGLESSERLLHALGDPQTQFTSIQIAGTNGKGSTASMLDSICSAAGIRRGLYTSPHLVSVTERIKINGRNIEEAEFAGLTTQVREAAEKLVKESSLAALPTFFEHVTAIALLAFSRANVKLAILETGLGGRLDASTAARASIAGITPISFDHQEYLGDTLPQIAAEKAAIIGEHTSAAVIAPQPPGIMAMIQRRCEKYGITPQLTSCYTEELQAVVSGRLRVTFKTQKARYENVMLALRGRHQIVNASLAIGLAEALTRAGFLISPLDVTRGLETSRHDGRLELIEGTPSILLDGAHNLAGAQALSEYLAEFTKEPVTVIFGAMREKDLPGMLEALLPHAERLVLTRPHDLRAAEPETIAGFLPPLFDRRNLEIVHSPISAFDGAQKATPKNGLVCVTGSLYLVGEIRGRLPQPIV